MTYKILKIGANPRDIGNIWRPRTQEFTGGYNGREMGNYGDLDVNPNENADGLSHHTRQTPEDGESQDQRDAKKRREKALEELAPGLRHIDLHPEKIEDTLGSSPMLEGENKLLETGLGVDLGANGLSLASGANVGSVRSDTPNITYGHPSRGMIRAGFDDDISDVFEILKARRRYKGRKYDEDEESEEDEKKSKRKSKRKKKRKGRRQKAFKQKHKSTGGREPKSRTKRRSASSALQLDTSSKRQSFNPASRSIPLRMRGSTRSEGIPLRLRDPIAYQRKLANDKAKRLMGLGGGRGAAPRSHTHHHSAEGSGLSETRTRGGYVGGTKGSTQMPRVPSMGLNLRSGAKQDAIARGAIGDPLGARDPLPMIKASKKISRAEILHIKKRIETLLAKLTKLTKASPILDEHSKRGGQASEERSSAPTGPTEVPYEESAAYRFDDTSLALGTVGKR